MAVALRIFSDIIITGKRNNKIVQLSKKRVLICMKNLDVT